MSKYLARKGGALSTSDDLQDDQSAETSDWKYVFLHYNPRNKNYKLDNESVVALEQLAFFEREGVHSDFAWHSYESVLKSYLPRWILCRGTLIKGAFSEEERHRAIFEKLRLWTDEEPPDAPLPSLQELGIHALLPTHVQVANPALYRGLTDPTIYRLGTTYDSQRFTKTNLSQPSFLDNLAGVAPSIGPFVCQQKPNSNFACTLRGSNRSLESAHPESLNKRRKIEWKEPSTVGKEFVQIPISLPTSRQRKRACTAAKMVGKKSGKALQLEEGLERTDNGMKQTSWPEVSMINQKNYYTEYMKRDDQILPLRLQAEANRDKMIQNAKDRDRALARTGNTDVPVVPDENFGEESGFVGNDGFDASRCIVIHPGSQNLRIGFASDALPKTIPMVAALRWRDTESDNAEPLPRRQQESGTAEQMFGEDFAKKYAKQSNDLKIDMRANKRKVLPNSKELVVNYNRRTPPEKIPEHNDPVRIEWTEHKTSDLFTGLAAQRIMDDSVPKFRCFWPIKYGWLNEQDPDIRSTEFLRVLLDDIFSSTFKNELGITKTSDLKKYSVVFVIPDLYEKKYVEEILELFMKEYEVDKICFIQESLAASFGAGYSNACIVDVGAQKTSISCVEDGMIIDDSRINLKYGGYDVTETFMKMMLFDNFPYEDINLLRRYDFLLAEELKINFCTMNQADISVQLYNFHLRAPNQPTRKYNFKTYDEVILAPMGFYDPSTFDNSKKLDGRRRLIDRYYNTYDPDLPEDPRSAAQTAILTAIKPALAINNAIPPNTNGDVSTPAKEKPQPFNLLSRFDSDAAALTPGTSAAGSPAPEGINTPNHQGYTNGNGNAGSPTPAYQFGGGSPAPPSTFGKTQKDMAIERDSVLPITPLDTAIVTSIFHAARGDEKKIRDLFGGIMVIGGGAKTPGFGPFLEERLKTKRPDLAEKILVGTSPREMDGQVVTWKGASVFGKLTVTNDTWITKHEFERLNSRVLHHKVHWNW